MVLLWCCCFSYAAWSASTFCWISRCVGSVLIGLDACKWPNENKISYSGGGRGGCPKQQP